MNAFQGRTGESSGIFGPHSLRDGSSFRRDAVVIDRVCEVYGRLHGQRQLARLPRARLDIEIEHLVPPGPIFSFSSGVTGVLVKKQTSW